MLDECDEMLNMGFVDDVEKILGANLDKTTVQTLLFSATLPPWVKDITRRFLKKDHKVIDLVGNERMKVGDWSTSHASGGGASRGCCGSERVGLHMHSQAVPSNQHACICALLAWLLVASMLHHARRCLDALQPQPAAGRPS